MEIPEEQTILNGTRPAVQPVPASPKSLPSAQTTSKLSEFWKSTPVWGAIGIFVSLAASSISTILLYFLIWLAFCIEFIRIRVLERRNIRYSANVAFSILLAVILLLIWPYLPKPKEQPNFDQQFKTLGDTLGEKLDRLRNSESPAPQKAQQSAAPLAEPGTEPPNPVKPRKQALIPGSDTIRVNAKFSCGPENYKPPMHSSNPPLGPTSFTLAFGTNEAHALRLALDDYAECRFQLSDDGSVILNGVELLLESGDNMEFYPDSDTAMGFRRNNTFRFRNNQLGGPSLPRIQIAANSKDGNIIPQPADIANGLSLKNDGEYKRLAFCLCKIPRLVSMFVLSYTLRAEDGNSGTAIKPIKGSIKFEVTVQPTPWASSNP